MKTRGIIFSLRNEVDKLFNQYIPFMSDMGGTNSSKTYSSKHEIKYNALLLSEKSSRTEQNNRY